MKKVAFFNNKGGVGKTTLVYHLACMMAEQGQRVLMMDLDPQSNLTAMCLSEQRLEEIWFQSPEHPETIWGCILPIRRGKGDIRAAPMEMLEEQLALIPGDMALSSFEDKLSESWPKLLDHDEASWRAQSAFHRIAVDGAKKHQADLVFIDIGPNLGAINRAALLSADFVVIPLAPDLFSVQGLRNLGPVLTAWRKGWNDRLGRVPEPDLELPTGAMKALGYIVMQSGMRLSRPVKAYERWVERMPQEYHKAMLEEDSELRIDQDTCCLGVMRHYQSLMPLAQEAQKPMFRLKPGDGAIGAHSGAVQRCYNDFLQLAQAILQRVQAAL